MKQQYYKLQGFLLWKIRIDDFGVNLKHYQHRSTIGVIILFPNISCSPFGNKIELLNFASTNYRFSLIPMDGIRIVILVFSQVRKLYALQYVKLQKGSSHTYVLFWRNNNTTSYKSSFCEKYGSMILEWIWSTYQHRSTVGVIILFLNLSSTSFWK